MEIFMWDSEHQVYASLKKVFGNEKMRKYKTETVMSWSSNHIECSNEKIGKENIYITKSPLVSAFTWKLKIKNAKMLIFEEYFAKSYSKDLVVKGVLALFKDKPFIAMTKRTERFLKGIGSKTIFIPPAEKKRNGNKKRKHILMVSRLEKTKNPNLFINLAKKFRDEKFILVGKGRMKEEIKKMVKDMDNFEYVEWVESRDKLFEMYADSKMLIHPAIREPIGFVIVEALSTSTPVLASKNAGASDFLPKEWTADPRNIKQWEEKIKNILEENEECVKKAEMKFEEENLNIESEYFKKKTKEVEGVIKDLESKS